MKKGKKFILGKSDNIKNQWEDWKIRFKHKTQQNPGILKEGTASHYFRAVFYP